FSFLNATWCNIQSCTNYRIFTIKFNELGILPIMLDDILKTRVMVKNSMKIHKSDENFQKISDARQLSLKLIANVTFGYTAANFSGRMPCVEVGDSIVRVARQALENSIKYIQSNQRTYGGRVVYGDTDSVFVLFEGMKKSDAFKNSYKLVEDITNMNVKPVKLKFEKIYFPCVLLAKKRYLGYMFESPEQAEPTLDVKGIEIIRRDGCQVSAKMLERSCKLLFEFKDVEKVKEYVQKQIMKLVNGKVNLKEFIIAKEYRGREYYDNAKSIAACQVANRSLLKDPLSEPLAGERVPYVIIYGLPGVPLYELVRSPHELIDNPDIKINYEYYVMKQVLPPLDRIMCLMNVNVFDWVKSLSFKPKIFQYAIEKGLKFNQPVSVANFVYSADCVLCGKKLNAVLNSKSGLCAECQQLDQNDLCKFEKNMNKILKMCQLCTDDKNLNVNYNHECKSLDCPINFIYISEKQILDSGHLEVNDQFEISFQFKNELKHKYLIIF
ncbi:DNA polymerase zeta catalytic subunit isoform X2, partial [Brachionus plicatilis]